MKKRAMVRGFCILLTVMLLLGGISVPTFAAERTEIGKVVATSDLDEVAVLYGRTDRLDYTVTEGEPVYFNQSWTTCWETYNEESGKWENYSGRFYPGRYRVFAQLRIDGEDGMSWVLAENVTCTVDGKAWTVDGVSVHYNYSCVFVTSPEIVIADDPALSPPVDVYDVYLDLNGYVAGRKFSETTFYPHLGSEGKVEIVEEPVFIDMTDANYDGIPDCIDPETGDYAPADDTIKENTPYMMVFFLKEKAGYDLYSLKSDGIHLSERETGMMSCFLSYEDAKECYYVSVSLRPCVTEVFFSIDPTDAVGYYRNDAGTVEISWETNGAVDKYQIYRWDEEAEWDVMPYTNVFGSSFVFEYQDGFTAGRYRIEAIKSGETVAVSDEFTVSWQASQPVKLPIRIDASAAVGSKVPVDLSQYYPESEAYEFAQEHYLSVNQWADAETGLPVDHFEHGKRYAYTVCVTAAEGYYFDIRIPPVQIGEDPIVPDAIRAYGIGWDAVSNAMDPEGREFATIFSFTYDGEQGIPAEDDRMLCELVFDGRPLVGMNSPTRIPDEVFAHEALTLCGEGCDCTKIPDLVKMTCNKWMDKATHQPAESFAPGAYEYVLYFHVDEGWKVPTTWSRFDFVISDAGVEVIDTMYNAEFGMLAVMIRFVCDEDLQIEAGEHVCAKRFVEETEPTCTENGTVAHYACSCGKVYLDKWGFQEIADLSAEGALPAHGHSFGSAWASDESGHWNTCACGEKANKASHADGNGDEACDVCGYAMSGACEDESGSGAGVIIGIIAGAVVLLGIGGFFLYRYLRRKKLEVALRASGREE